LDHPTTHRYSSSRGVRSGSRSIALKSRCSQTVDVPGSTSSCGTYPEIARISFAETRTPSTRTVPREAWPLGVRPARKSSSVDLPAPDGPRIANTPEPEPTLRVRDKGSLGPGPAWPETPRRIFFTTPPGLDAVTAVAYTRTFSQLTTGRARAVGALAEDGSRASSSESSASSDKGTRSSLRDRSPSSGSRSLSGEARRARRAPSTALGVLTCLLGARGPPARIAATCSNAAAAGTEYSDALSSLTYHAAAKTSATATNAMTTLVMRSPVQNSGGVNTAGHAFFTDSSPPPAPSYTQFPTSHVTANDGMTPCWFQ